MKIRIFGFCQTLLRSFISYKTPCVDGSKRFLFHNRKLVRRGLLGIVGCGFGYYWNLERVPYTKRSHVVFFPTSFEIKAGKSIMENYIKPKYQGKILPPLHPLSIRTQRIGQGIVEAAEKGLNLKEEKESMFVKLFKKLGKRDYHQFPQFEWEFIVVDKPTSSNAFCFPGGKLVFFSGLFRTCESDAQIAATIAHEVGHAIARHAAEDCSRLPGLKIVELFLYWSINLHFVPAVSQFLARAWRHSAEKVVRGRGCPAILKLFLYWKANLNLIPAISEFLIRLPNSRRHEKEADYIGLMLMAIAGHDPRVAVEFWEKQMIMEIAGHGLRVAVEVWENKDVSDWPWKDYAHTHPNSKKRAQLLSQSKVMEKALYLYQHAVMRRSTDMDGGPQF